MYKNHFIFNFYIKAFYLSIFFIFFCGDPIIYYIHVYASNSIIRQDYKSLPLHFVVFLFYLMTLISP